MADAVTTTPFVNVWLARSQSPTILHLFRNACNLTNEAGELISLVLPDVGPGPFALVLNEPRPFPDIISLESSVSIKPAELQLGDLIIDRKKVSIWNPIVAWEKWQRQRAVWQQTLPEIERMLVMYRAQIGEGPTIIQQRLQGGLVHLLKGLQFQNQTTIQRGVQQLAGLGRGLTPAGDDVLLGVIYGLWAIQSRERCRPLIDLIVKTAVPQTTSLSRAWLRAAGRGEAVAAWHELGYCLSASSNRWQAPIDRILSTGHSSGVDALWGFTAVISHYLREKAS